MRYEFVNPEEVTGLEPGKTYNTRVVDAYWKDGELVVELEYLGTEHDPKNPQCLFPVAENQDYYVHPFTD